MRQQSKKQVKVTFSASSRDEEKLKLGYWLAHILVGGENWDETVINKETDKELPDIKTELHD